MRKFILYGIAALLLIVSGYFAFIYYIPFSEGVRAGELIKISRKGVIMKTWEGEISQGISGAQIFAFSVLDKDTKVIEDLQTYQGKYVKITYVERYKTFPWWGDTKYFVTDVQQEETPHLRR